MRSKFSTSCLALIASIGLGCVSAVACDVFFDLNGADPQTFLPPPYDQFGSAHWVDHGDGTGYLAITDAVNGAEGVIIMRDCDNGASISSFAIDLDVRLGGGTSQPASGLSVNYTRADDPIFTKAPTANGSDFGFACVPGTTECGYTTEEGTTTGLAVCLDEWFSGGSDVIGITIRLDGTIIVNYPFPTLNGDSTDLTSLQTYDGYTGPGTGVGKFVPLHMEVTPDAKVIVRYKIDPATGQAHEVTPPGGLPSTFAPSPGSLILAARTDGVIANHHVDNIHIVTKPICLPFNCSQVIARPTGFSFSILDTPLATFDPATGMLSIRLDGHPVTPESVTKAGGVTTVKVNLLPTILPPNSTHQVDISFKGSSGVTIQESSPFTIGIYTLIPASYITTHLNPATAAPGFKVRLHQLPVPRWGYPGCDPNGNREMENELADGYINPATGQPYANLAELHTDSPDEWPDVFYADVINYGGGSDGRFPNDNRIPWVLTLIGPSSTDWDAMDIEAFLELKAGYYRFGVNSDDGFLFKFGAGRGDIFGTVAGSFNTGRGAADSIFDVLIPADGFYPIRCDWENGTGGANIEIFTVNLDDGTFHLVNDLTDPQSVPAFRGGYAQAYAKSILPVLGDTDAHENLGVVVKLMDDGPSTVNQASISMTLDGTTYPSGDPKLHIDNSAPPLTVVSLDGPAGGFAPGSSHTGTINFNGNTYNFNFTVTWLPKGIFVIEAEDFDSTDPATGITTHNPLKGTPGADTDYVPAFMPYLGGAFQGLSARSGVDYQNNDSNDSDLYRLGESPNVNMDPGPGNSLNDHPGLHNRGAYNVTTNYKIGWDDAGDWEDYTRDFGPTPTVFKVVIALSSRTTGDDLRATMFEVNAGQGTTSQTLNTLGSFHEKAFGAWGVNSVFPLKDSTGDDAVVRYSGVRTVRINQDAGDFDWFAFVPVFVPAKITGVNPSAADTVARNTPIVATLADLSTTVVLGSIHLVVNGVDVVASATVVHDPVTGITTVTYNPSPVFAVSTPVTYTVSFTDSAGATSSATVNYMTDPIRGPGDFVIEIEDFNFNAGQHLAISDVMPYYGGAYQDRTDTTLCNQEIFDIDYHNDDGLDSNLYRLCETGPNVSLDPGPGGTQLHRSGWDVTTNYKMGWVGTPDWNNYTRVFPKGDYKVYAALSFDGTDAGQCHGRLQSVQHPDILGDQGLTDLGTFDAHGTHNLGGWGWNTLIPMRTPDGCVAVIHLDGLASLRYNADSGDSDYLTFVPAEPFTATSAGTITGIGNNGNGTLTITWTGPGELQVADDVTGPWAIVPGATSPLTAPIDRAHRFARLVVCRDEPESWPQVP